jgi:hypothetical protein
MTREEEWRREWEVLRAARGLARSRWRDASGALAARAKDPLGLSRAVHDYPIAAAGIGAMAGALLVKVLLGGRRREAEAPPAAGWAGALRDAALGVAIPWLLRVLQGKAGGGIDPSGPPEAPGEPAYSPVDCSPDP